MKILKGGSHLPKTIGGWVASFGKFMSKIGNMSKRGSDCVVLRGLTYLQINSTFSALQILCGTAFISRNTLAFQGHILSFGIFLCVSLLYMAQQSDSMLKTVSLIGRNVPDNNGRKEISIKNKMMVLNSISDSSEMEMEESEILSSETEECQMREWQVCLVNSRIRLGLTFHMSSDFFFDLDSDHRHSVQEQMLSFSHFKRILQMEHRPREMVVIIRLENAEPPLRDFKMIRDMLKNQRFKRLQIISGLLGEYETTLKRYEQQIALLSVQRMLNLCNFETKMALRKEYFNKKMYEKLNKLSQNGIFFSFVNTSVNINTGALEIVETGYSEALISLLGSDPKQFTATLMRKGPIEVISQRNRDIFTIGRLMYEVLGIRENCEFEKGVECTLITFDELEVHCLQQAEHFFVDFPDELKLNDDKFKKEHVVILKYEVSVETIKSIIAMRQQNRFMENNDWVNDFGYSVMSEILLEKFYKIKSEPKQQAPKKESRN